MQWTLGGTAGDMSLSFARHWLIPSQPEGVAADDGLGLLYVGEEDGGIWRFDADPAAPTTGTLIDKVGSACLPVDDVEGMGVFDAGNGAGYLVVSAQGVNRYALYPRQPGANGEQNCICSFGIATGATDPVGRDRRARCGLGAARPQLPAWPCWSCRTIATKAFRATSNMCPGPTWKPPSACRNRPPGPGKTKGRPVRRPYFILRGRKPG